MSQHTRERTGWDPVTGTYHAYHDWEGPESLCYTVLVTVSAVTGESPEAMKPMSDAVDTDAVDALFDGAVGGRDDDHVVFTVSGCSVLVQRDGHVVVSVPDPA